MYTYKIQDIKLAHTMQDIVLHTNSSLFRATNTVSHVEIAQQIELS